MPVSDITLEPSGFGGDGPKRIGPYKLLQQIGEGGMGTVWMAEQEKPVRRRVALKLIKGAMADKQVIARFEAERQALAMMDHANIAKVLDAGTTETGNPFFVMELVQGIAINEYCDRNKLTPDERLRLFVQVCKAVQHAHQKGIIHRDLKPSNVLVQMSDGEPMAKVIDFGLAKALQHQTKLTDKTLFTEFGQVVGTLQYMSPEQATMDAMNVDTRTDVYSLGVMLYELLAGSTPIEKETLRNNALLQVLQAIREKEPPKPSHRLSNSGEKLSTISELRQIQPGKLHQILRGELDWIVMKALEKDRTRRYESANDFARDINNYLNGDSVNARPPSTSYQLQKFARKNRGLVAALAGIGLVLLVGIIGTSYGLIQAKQKTLLAETKSAEAEEQKQLAIEKTREAEQERKTAQENETKALAAKKQTELEKLRADTESTRARDSEAEAKLQLSLARWDSDRAEDARDLLHQVPKEYRDNFEWRFCQRHFLGSDVTCYGHHGPVYCVDFDPTGSRVASCSSDNTIKIWDATDGSHIATLLGHESGVRSVAFSSDGELIVSGSDDQTIKLWNSQTGREIKSLVAHESSVRCVAFSSNSEMIASGDHDGSIKIFETSTGSEILSESPYRSRVISISFTPDDKQVVCAGGKGIQFWDVESGSMKKEISARTRCMALSPDGHQIAIGQHDLVTIWDVRSGANIESLSAPSALISDVAFSPDGRRIVSTGHGTIRVWDIAAKAELVATLKGHSSVVCSVAFSPDGARLVTGGFENKTVKLWDACSGSESLSLRGHKGVVTSIAFSPDSKLLASASSDRSIKIWDVSSGVEIACLTGHEKTVSAVKFSPDGESIATSSGGTIKIWSAKTGEIITEFKGHSGPVNDVAFSPDGSQLASGGIDKTVKIWNISNPAQPITLAGHTSTVTCVAFSPNGEQIVSGSRDSSVRIWNASSGTNEATIEGYPNQEVTGISFSADGNRIAWGCRDRAVKIADINNSFEITTRTADNLFPVHGVSFNPNGSRFASVDNSGRVKIWNAIKATETMTLNRHWIVESALAAPSKLAVVISPDGLLLAVTDFDNSIKIWHVDATSEKRILVGHVGRVNTASFSRDGATIASGSKDNTIKLWDSVTGSEIHTLRGHLRWVSKVAFSPDGSLIASGGQDKFVKIWDVQTGSNISSLHGHKGWVFAVAFSPDGSLIASGGQDKLVKIWDVRTGLNIATLSGHKNTVYQVRFSDDGQKIYSSSTDSNFKSQRLVWSVEDQNVLEEAAWKDYGETNGETKERRWFLTIEGKNVVLVDQAFKRNPQELAYRKAKSRFNAWWHLQQATKAEKDGDWYAAAFHHAWLLREDTVNGQSSKRSFLKAYDNLVKEYAKFDEELALPAIVEEAARRISE